MVKEKNECGGERVLLYEIQEFREAGGGEEAAEKKNLRNFLEFFFFFEEFSKVPLELGRGSG